jgi:hypothetical protein
MNGHSEIVQVPVAGSSFPNIALISRLREGAARRICALSTAEAGRQADLRIGGFKSAPPTPQQGAQG